MKAYSLFLAVLCLPLGLKAQENVLDHFCLSCHGKEALIEVGAPKIHDISAWRVRKKQGIDQLLQHVIEGKGAMPPRGGCFECSDEELKHAIEQLISSPKHGE